MNEQQANSLIKAVNNIANILKYVLIGIESKLEKREIDSLLQRLEEKNKDLEFRILQKQGEIK